MNFELKPLSPEAVPAALDKAVRYRLLNEPVLAESICRDIIAVEPDNEMALINLLLSLSDQFDSQLSTAFKEAQECVPRLEDEYHRLYYGGIICERRANVHLERANPGSGSLAYDWYRRAMEMYEKAFELRPASNDEALLRWNTCVRVLARHAELKPAPEDQFHPFLE